MKFEPDTRLLIADLTFLARLKQRHDCGPLTQLDAAQRAMLAAFDQMYPREKLHAVARAGREGRDYLIGADLPGGS